MPTDNELFPVPAAVYPGDNVIPPAEVPDYVLQQAHAGLLIPSPKTNHSIYRELRKWRGAPNPDLL